jgi:DNA-binding NarL/FixJ family response regulator
VIRVFLADDERLVREGLRKLLELGEGLEVVGEASDGDQVVEAVARQAVDVLLLDVRMPRRSGLEVLDDLRTAPAAPPTLMLTTFDEPGLLLDAVRRGAQGFLSKDVSLEELRAAIGAVARGDNWFQPALTHALRRGVSERPRLEDTGPLDALTDREVEVLRLMAGGLTNREIAATLATAEGTVKNQVSSILSKLGVRDRTLAVLKAIESGRI